MTNKLSALQMELEERRQVHESVKGVVVYGWFDRKHQTMSGTIFNGDLGGDSRNAFMVEWEQSDKNPIFEGQRRYKVISLELSVQNSNWR